MDLRKTRELRNVPHIDNEENEETPQSPLNQNFEKRLFHIFLNMVMKSHKQARDLQNRTHLRQGSGGSSTRERNLPEHG